MLLRVFFDRKAIISSLNNENQITDLRGNLIRVFTVTLPHQSGLAQNFPKFPQGKIIGNRSNVLKQKKNVGIKN